MTLYSPIAGRNIFDTLQCNYIDGSAVSDYTINLNTTELINTFVLSNPSPLLTIHLPDLNLFGNPIIKTRILCFLTISGFGGENAAVIFPYPGQLINGSSSRGMNQNFQTLYLIGYGNGVIPAGWLNQSIF